MSTASIKEITDRNTWEDFVLEHSPTVVLQSWDWGQFQQKLGRDVWYLGIFEDDELVGSCLSHLVPTKMRTHIYTSNGPLCDWETSGNRLRVLIDYLKNKAREHRAQFIRMDPLISDNDENRTRMKGLGFKPAATNIQAEHRWILDITPDEETLLSEMRKNTRYAIRRSRKEGVAVSSGTGKKQFEKFWPLFEHTVRTQNFVPHPKEYYLKQIDAFTRDGDYRIYWAEREGTILASALIPFYGDSAYYLHAASNDRIKNTFPAHALIWKAIRDAKSEGLSYFDFWGVAPTDDKSHPWAGFTFFKKGFGGFQQDVIRAHDLPLSPQYHLTRILESTRRTWGRTYYNLINR